MTPAAASIDLPQTGAKAGKMASAGLAQALEQATVLVVSAGGESGSGFFVAPNYVVTNHHVVARAAPGTEVLVLSKHLKTGYIGTVVATSQPGQATQADFAVIKVDDVPAGSVRPLPVAAEPAALSDVVAAGYPSIAIAQDRNLRRLLAGDLKAAPEVVLTKGTVSAVQNKERNTPMVLHSADISAGNSGGPLINSCGRVVGINTYIVTSRQTTKANYALGSSWLAGFLRASKLPSTGVPTAVRERAKNHLPNTRCSFNLTPLLNHRCGRGREAGSRYNTLRGDRRCWPSWPAAAIAWSSSIPRARSPTPSAA